MRRPARRRSSAYAPRIRLRHASSRYHSNLFPRLWAALSVTCCRASPPHVSRYSSRRRRRCWASHSRSRSSFRCRGRRSLASSAAATAIGSRRRVLSACILVSTSHVQPLHVTLKANRIDVVRPPAARHLNGRAEWEPVMTEPHSQEHGRNAHDAGGLFNRHPGLVAHHATSSLKKISVISLGVRRRISDNLRTSPIVKDSPELFLSFRYSVERSTPILLATCSTVMSCSTILAR